MSVAQGRGREVWRRWRTWAGLSGRERGGFLLAWVLLAVADLAIVLVPFDRLAAYLGRSVSPGFASPPLTADQPARATEIGATVRRAARYAPWPARCLAQALVTRALLGWAGISCVTHLGMRRSIGGGNGAGVDSSPARAANPKDVYHAHAWVEAGAVLVVGGRASRRDYTVVGTFLKRIDAASGAED